MVIMRSTFLFALILLILPLTASAQVPISGVTGTTALQGNVDSLYDGASKIVVKTADGIQHLLHITKGTSVHDANGDRELRDIHAGTPVVVHYTMVGAEASAQEIDDISASGLKTTEGVVTKVDRKNKTIALRLANGSTQTLRLSDRAAADDGREIAADGAGQARVIVYYGEEHGQKVAHYFTKVP
jgi:hypothetical protein